MRLVDLSHVVEHGTVTYPGLPAPIITDYLSFDGSHERYAAGTEFQIGRIEMVANTGTYLDTPAHRWRDGFDLSGLALEQVADLPGICVDDAGPVVGAASFAGIDVTGRAVLVRTGWDRHWGTPEYAAVGHPGLTADSADLLVAAGAALVGIDSVNIDRTETGERPVHSTLLRAGIPIVEHLTGLAALGSDPFRFFAVPVKVRGMATFPIRAFAVVGDD